MRAAAGIIEWGRSMGRFAGHLMQVRHNMYLTGAQQVIFCMLQSPGRYVFGEGATVSWRLVPTTGEIDYAGSCTRQ